MKQEVYPQRVNKIKQVQWMSNMKSCEYDGIQCNMLDLCKYGGISHIKATCMEEIMVNLDIWGRPGFMQTHSASMSTRSHHNSLNRLTHKVMP